MDNGISATGFYMDEENDHVFIQELSDQINLYIKKHDVKSVYDFGCGEGDYLQKVVDMDPSISATGFEGHQTDVVFKNVIKLDLSEPTNLEPVDMVISIEVGEHIPKEFEQTFIDNLTKSASKHLFMSWARPGQHGRGHINCQSNQYIISEITKRGWTFDEKTTEEVRSKMPPIWIKHTVMIFQKS